MNKVLNYLTDLVAKIKAWFLSESVQTQINAVGAQFRATKNWVVDKCNENPAAAAAGAAAATVTIIAASVITVGLVISVVLFSLAALGAHKYFAGPPPSTQRVAQ